MQIFNSDTGKELANTARHGIANPPKSGNIYSYKGRKHRASSAGQFPANRSGLLRRRTTFKAKSLSMEFGTQGVAYAPALQQFKTAQQRSSTWSRLAPRPYLTLSHDIVITNKTTGKMISAIQSEMF